MEGIETLLTEVPLFEGMEPAELELIAGCAKNVRFEAGDVVFREGDPADAFYVVRHGTVAIEAHAPPRPAMTIETIGAGEVIGWSWIVPPYRWNFDARALSQVR